MFTAHHQLFSVYLHNSLYHTSYIQALTCHFYNLLNEGNILRMTINTGCGHRSLFGERESWSYTGNPL